MRFIQLVLSLMFLASFVATTAADDGFVSLFNGRTLAGWKPLPSGHWTVTDGMIVGSQLASGRLERVLLRNSGCK